MIDHLLRRLRPERPIPAEVMAFQDDLDALIGEPVPAFLRYWPGIAGALILALIATAAVLRVDVVITAQGRLMADVPPVVLQPAGSAVLRELRVRAGQMVTAGQVIAVLDSTFTEADRDSLDAQRRALLARRDRLRAELDGGAAAPEHDDAGEAALQGALRDQRRAYLASSRAALDTRLDALESALRSEQDSGRALDEQLGIAREVEAMRTTLADQKVGSRLGVLEAKAARLSVEDNQRQHIARLQELTHQIDAQRAERDAFLDDWRRQMLEELASVGPELIRVEEQLAKADRLDALTVLRAPRDGTVLEVIRRAPGSLMREGEQVATLVPTGVPLIAEISLPSGDIGRLQPRDPAVLKIDSFPWRRYGALDGHLRAISRESYPSEDKYGGVALHRGQITLDTETLSGATPDATPEARLVPGMTLTAELKIGTRSVLDFFLDPLMRGLRESLREP